MTFQKALPGMANIKIVYPIGFVCLLCWGFTAQSTQWGHVERRQFT